MSVLQGREGVTMQKCMRCGSEFRTPADHDRCECRKQIIVGLSEQILGQRTTNFKLSQKIRGQRKRLRNLESVPHFLVKCVKEKAELEQKYEAEVGVVKRELEQVQDALRIEQETRQQSVEFARADFDREAASHKSTKESLRTAHADLREAKSKLAETQSQLAASTDKVGELSLSNKMLGAANEAARKAETHWRKEAKKRAEELLALNKRVEEIGRELTRRMVNKVYGEKMGHSTLYYCGCEHRGDGAPVFCPGHLSPQTKEGLLDGR